MQAPDLCNLTLRSLYRYNFLKKMKSPQIILENEERILKKYLLSLSKKEIKYISDNFANYNKEQIINDEITNAQLDKSFKRHLANLN